jgi:enoyl-CoA hydratase/carnithine racemase
VDDDDDDAESESEGDEGEEGEMVAAGKEALMYGMVGGVVVKEEDLAAGGEELLRKLARGQDGGGGGGDAGQVTPTPAAAVRTDFYQSDTTVTVSIFEKGLIPADVRIEFKESEVSFAPPDCSSRSRHWPK